MVSNLWLLRPLSSCNKSSLVALGLSLRYCVIRNTVCGQLKFPTIIHYNSRFLLLSFCKQIAELLQKEILRCMATTQNSIEFIQRKQELFLMHKCFPSLEARKIFFRTKILTSTQMKITRSG